MLRDAQRMSFYKENIISIGDAVTEDLIIKELNKRSVILRFPDILESVFLEYYLHHAIVQIRLSLFLGMFLYAIFGILDAWIFPGMKRQLWIIRYLIVCPGLLFAFLYSLVVKKELTIQLVYSLVIILAGSGIIAMLIMVPKDIGNIYYAGLMLVIFYAYIFSRLRFVFATVCAWLITLIYVFVSVNVQNLYTPFIVNNTFFLVSSNIIGMGSCYMLEKYVRNDFLKTALLQIEKIQLEKSNIKLQELSYIDGLTNVPNRRQFEKALREEWNRALRQGHPLSLLMIDIDNFKLYNDHMGHVTGDECLIMVAEVIKSFGRRPGDHVARFGGEEFCVILSGTDSTDAKCIADEIRKKIKDMRIPHPASQVSEYVTVSVGVATVVPDKGRSKDELLREADKALYMAKKRGGDCTVVIDITDSADKQ